MPQSDQHISLLGMPGGQRPGAETLGPWPGRARQRVCPVHGRHEEQLKEHASSAAPALPVVGWGLQCRRHVCLCRVSRASLTNNQVFPECFRRDALEHTPTFSPAAAFTPNSVSAHQQLLPIFPLEQVSLDSHLK